MGCLFGGALCLFHVDGVKMLHGRHNFETSFSHTGYHCSQLHKFIQNKEIFKMLEISRQRTGFLLAMLALCASLVLAGYAKSEASTANDGDARVVASVDLSDDDSLDDGDEAFLFEEGVDWFEVAATALDMDVDDLWTKWVAGESLAAVAREAGVDVQVVVDSLVTAETNYTNEQVTAGTISQADADAWLAGLPVYVQNFVDEMGERMDYVEPEADMAGDWFAVSAEAIGVDVDALFEAESVAAVAEAHNVAPATVVEAIVTSETEAVNQLVASSELTQEEANELLSDVQAMATEFVNDVYEDGAEMGDEDDFFDGALADAPDWNQITADALGMDLDALFEAFDTGASVTQLATQKGVDVQSLKDALELAERTYWNDKVASGTFTQAEADEWLTTLAEDVAQYVNAGWVEQPDWVAMTANILGLGEDEMWQVLEENKSLVQVAADRNVAIEVVAEALTTAERDFINQLLADGSMTQVEADEWLEAVPDEVNQFLEGVPALEAEGIGE